VAAVRFFRHKAPGKLGGLGCLVGLGVYQRFVYGTLGDAVRGRISGLFNPTFPAAQAVKMVPSLAAAALPSQKSFFRRPPRRQAPATGVGSPTLLFGIAFTSIRSTITAFWLPQSDSPISSTSP